MKAALVSEVAPEDIRTRHDPVVDTATIPGGISYDDLDPGQQQQLRRLVRRYFERAPAEHAELCWSRVGRPKGWRAILGFAWVRF
jgi:hypothetical protein